MSFKGYDPEERRKWGRDYLIFGTFGMIGLCIYLVLTNQAPLWMVPMLIVGWLALGYVAGVANYHRALFMKNLIRSVVDRSRQERH